MLWKAVFQVTIGQAFGYTVDLKQPTQPLMKYGQVGLVYRSFFATSSTGNSSAPLGALFRVAICLFFILSMAGEAMAQAWDPFHPATLGVTGTAPKLRKENRTLSVVVNVSMKARIYYAVYTLANDPGIGAITAAALKAGTTPNAEHTFASSATGIIFGDASYCRSVYPAASPAECAAVDGEITRDRAITFEATAATTYVLYAVAEDFAVANAFSPIGTHSIVQNTTNQSCFRVGSTTLGPVPVFSPNLANNCSPASFTLIVGYAGVDWATASLPVNATVNFGDASATGTLQNLTLQNSPLGTPELNKAFRLYQAVLNKTYDYTLGANPAANPTGSACTFFVDVEFNAGATDCSAVSGADQSTTVTVWDRPDTPRGLQDVQGNGLNSDDGGIDDEEYEICQTDRSAILLTDNSVYNCTTIEDARAPLPNSPNREARWVQWVYGAAGTTVTTSGAANDQVTIGGVNFTAAQLPIYGPVIYVPASITANNPALTNALSIRMPVNAASGAVLMVELRSWNTCLPYDNDVSNGGTNPVGGTFDLDLGAFTTASWMTQVPPATTGANPGVIFANANSIPETFQKPIVTVPSPAPPTVPAVDICSGDPRTIRVSPTIGGLQYRLWSDAAATVAVGGVGNPSATGIFTNVPVNTGQRVHYWVTAESTGAGNCRGLPTETTITRRPALGTPANPTGPTNVCPSTTGYVLTTTTTPDNVDFDDTSIAGAVNFTMATEMVWTVPVAAGTITAGTGTNSITVTSSATVGLNTVTVARQYTTNTVPAAPTVASRCQSGTGSKSFNPRAIPTSTISPDPALVCTGNTLVLNGNPVLPAAGAPPGFAPSISSHLWTGSTGIIDNPAIQAPTVQNSVAAGTYNLTYTVTSLFEAGVTCAGSDNITVTVGQTPPKPTITPSGVTTFCFGGNVTLSSSTVSASTYRWYRNGVFTGTVTQNINLTTVAQSGTYTVETVGPTPNFCVSPLSDPIVVTIHALPTATGPTGGGPVCSGTPAADIVFTLTGTAPFTGTWTDGVGTFPLTQPGTTLTPTSFTIGNPITTSAGTYSLVTLVDANGCSATALGGSAVITISGAPPPALQFPATAGAAVCHAGGATNPPDATFDFTPNSVQTYDILYTINGGAPIAVTKSTDAAGILVIDPTYAQLGSAPGSFAMVITSIINSGTGCSGAVPIPGPTLVVHQLPVVANQTATICSDTQVGANFNASSTVAAAAYNVTAVNLNGLTVSAGGPVTGMKVAADLFDDAFTNTTGGNVNVIYTVTPISGTTPACSGTAFTVTVTVRPEPAVANQVFTVCSDTPIGSNFGASTGIAAATYNVTALNLNGLTVSAGGATAPDNGLLNTALANDAFTNTGLTQVDVIYTVTPVSSVGNGSCSGNPFTVTVHVDPEPVVLNQTPAAICSKAGVGVNFRASEAGSVAATSYNVTAVNLNGLTVFAGGPITGVKAPADLANDAFTNTTGSPVNVIYTVTPIAGTCSGTPFSITVPVTPEPVLAGPFTKTICSGEAVNYSIALTPAGLPAATVYNWPAPTMSDLSVQGTIGTNQPVGTVITDVLINLSATPTTATYNITPTNGSCNGTMQAVVITINPIPAVENVIGSASVCVSLNPVVYSITNYDNLDLTTSYSWSIPAGFNRLSGGGGAVPGGGFGPFTAGDGILVLNFPVVATGQIQVIKRNNFNCQTTAIPLTVTSVAAPPVLPIDVDPAPYCHNQTGVKFFISAPNPASTYSWSIAAGAGTISGSSVGPIISVNLGVGPFVTVSVTETNTIGCATTFVPETILINPVPDILATPASQTLCSGTNTNIVLSTPNGTPGTTYTWTVAQSGVTGGSNQAVGVAGPINQTLSTLGAAVGTATYTITPTAGGCAGTPVNVVVTVNPLPTVAASPLAPTQCSGQTTNIALSNPNAVAGTLYYWTVVQVGVTGASNGGTFVTPVAGPIAQTLTTTAAAQGTATYTIHPVANGCEGPTINVVVTVDPIPNVAFTPVSQTICSGQTSGIALSTPNGVPGAAYFWTVVQSGVVGGTNDGTVTSPITGPIAQSLLTTGSAPGTATYTVTPVAAGCVGTALPVVVTVNPIPNVAATPPSSTICSGATTNIALSTPNLVAGTQYTWTVVQSNVSGATNQAVPTSGPISQALTATTSAPGSATYTITPSANGCSGTPIDVVITVNPLPNVLSTPGAQTICSGQSTGLVLSNPNAVAGTQYFWTVVQAGVTGASAQGSLISPVSGPISQALTTTGSVQGTATYTVTPVANGCTGTPLNVIVTVNPVPNVVATPAAQTICSGGTTGIALSTTNGVAGTQYFWTVTQSGVTGAFAQGTVGAPVSGPIAQTLTTTISATGTATYVITPVASGCTGTPISVIITVDPVPVGVTSTMTLCSDVALGVSLNSFVVGGALAASTYNITSISNASGLVASAGAPVTGTGFTATEIQDDRWTNTQGVQRDIIYTIVPISSATCTGAPFTLTVHVDPEPVVAAVANQIFCPTDAINIPLTSNAAGSTISWTNTNTAIGLAASGTGDIIYAAPANNTGANVVGTITVTATRNGCVSAGANIKTFTITIRPTPIMVANSNVVVCSGGNVAAITFSANTGGGETFNWTNSNIGIGLGAVGTGNISSFAAGVNISGSPIVGTISVSAVRNGCAGPVSNFTITVNPEPVVAAVANQTFCPGDAVNIPLTSNVAGAAITWTNTNTSIGAGATGAGDVVYIAPANNTGVNIVGTITVSATANTCVSAGANQKTFTITIKPSPIMNNNTNVSVCSGTAVPLVTFSANTGGGETFNWTNDNVAIGLAASGAGNIASYIAPVNTSGAAIVGTISVSGTLNACTGPAKTFTITILPQPVGVSTPVTVCSDAAVGINLSTLITGALGASTYNITAITNLSGLVSSAGSPAIGNGLSATEVQNDRWTNATGVQHDIVYTIVPVSGATCQGAPFTLTVHVDPEPVVAVVANQSFCPTDAINIPLTSNVVGATLNWTNSNPTIGLAASGTGDIIYAAPANNTGADLVGTITVSATANGCTSAGANVKTFTITIRPTPIMAANSNVAVCSGGNVATITFSANTGGGETFNWTNSNTLIGLGASGAGNIAPFIAAANVTGSPIVATIGVSAIRNGCPGPVSNFTITVNPEPVVTPVTDVVACSGTAVAAINFTTNAGGGETFSWTNTNPSIGLAASGFGPIPSYTAPINVSGVDIVGTITVSATLTGCVSAGGNVETFTITIRSQPVGGNDITPIVNSDAVLNYDLQNNVNTLGNTMASTFSWVAANNSNVSGESLVPVATAFISDILHNVTNTNQSVLYTVTPTSGGCTGAPFFITVTVRPEPVGVDQSITVNSDVNINYNLQANVNGVGNGLPSTFTWVTTDNPFLTGESLAIQTTASITDIITNTSGVDQVLVYTVTPTGTNGVPGDPFFITVTIRSEPVGSDDVATICSNNSPNYDLQNNLNTPPGNGQAATFTWFAGSNLNVIGESIALQSGPFITDVLRNFNGGDETVTYFVTPTGTNGCPGNTFQIVVTVQPEPVVATNLNETQCSGVAYGRMLNTNGISVGALTYDVDVVSIGAGITGGRPVGPVGTGLAANVLMADAYTNTTSVPLNVTYSVIANGTNGCVGEARLVVFTINPAPALAAPVFPAVCSSNTAISNIVNVVFGTNGTSVAATLYQLLNIQYSNGGPFGVGLPAGFTAFGINATPGLGNNDYVRNDRFTNLSAVPVTVRYTVRGFSGATCASAPLDYDVTINPEPTLDPGLSPAAVCSGEPSGVTLAVAGGSVAAVTYNINSITFHSSLTAGGGNAGIGNGKLANAIFNDVYVNTSSLIRTVTYMISPVSAAGCIGPEQSVTLTIQRSPDLDNNLNRTVCINSNAGLVFTTSSAEPAVNYNLISVTPVGALVPAGGNVAPAMGVAFNYASGDQFNNPTNGPLTVAYVVEPVSAASCRGPQETITLTIEPTIVAGPFPAHPAVCSTSGNGADPTNIVLTSPTSPSAGVITFNYTAVSSIGTQITGFIPALSGLSGADPIADNLVNNSDNPAFVRYTITPVANGAAGGNGCFGLPVQVDVFVEPKPKLTALTAKTVCEGAPVAIALSSPTNPSAGTVEFELISAIDPTGFVTGDSPDGTIFTDPSTLNDVLANGDVQARTITYRLRPRINGGAGCVGDDFLIAVTVNPLPTVTAPPQPQICNGDIVDIVLTTDVAATVPTWTANIPAGVTGASNGAGDRIFQILFNNTTGTGPLTVTYDVTPNAAGCLGTMLSIPVVVNPLAKVTGTPSTVTVCHGTTLNVPLNSNVTAGVSYSWTIIDSSGGLIGGAVNGTGNVINQTLTNTTGAQATLTYTITPLGPGPGAGCVGQDKLLIVTVSPQITATWLSTPNPDFVCKDQDVFLVLSLGGRAPFNYSYNDGSLTYNHANRPPVVVLQHDMQTTTQFTVTSVTDGLGCTTPFALTYDVNVDDTDPTFTIVNPIPIAQCSPNEVTFQYDQVIGTQYTWRFGNAADSVYTATTANPVQQIKHTYTNTAPVTVPFNVTLSTELDPPSPYPNGCGKTSAPQTIQVLPIITPVVSANLNSICSGQQVMFSNSTSGTTGQTWHFREKFTVAETFMSSAYSVNFNFTNNTLQNPIVYEVLFRPVNGFCDPPPTIIEIEVFRHSVASFTESPASPIDYISGQANVTFTNTSTILDASDFQYEWVFGVDADPGISSVMAPPMMRYLSPGPKVVTLTVTNIAKPQCRTTFTDQIDIVLPPLVATFDVNPKEACFPAKISVDPAATVITGDIIEWTVVDENNRPVATSTGVYPEFNLPTEGLYTVKLRTASSMDPSAEAFATDVQVVVYGKPFASFDARPDVVFVPDTEMTLFNFSTNPEDLQFTWDFGDGDVLTSPPAPSNTAAVPLGTHNDRTKGTYEEPIHIYKVEGIYDITMIAAFDHGNNVVCSDTLKQQVQARQGGVTKVPNAFTPGLGGPNGGQSSNGSFNDVFLPIVKGADEFNLQIYDRWGNLIFESNSAQVGWDGYNNSGQLMPAGVYVYKLTVRLSDGQRSTQVGDVTMIR